MQNAAYYPDRCLLIGTKLTGLMYSELHIWEFWKEVT